MKIIRPLIARGGLWLVAGFFLLASCNYQLAGLAAFSNPALTNTPFQPQEVPAKTGAAQVEVPTAEQTTDISWWVSPALPAGLRAQIAFPEGAREASAPKEADVLIAVAEGEIAGYWTYALVAPFPTLIDEVTLRDVQRAWQGRSGGPFEGTPLMMAAETQALFAAWWGEPAESAVQVVAAEELVDAAWAAQPSWALIPFEALQPKWKVLVVDGQSPVWKDFEAAEYALNVPVGIVGLASGDMAFEIRNRDADKLTTLITTGVTALVRATAWDMERKGLTYPAEDVGDLLRDADITHVSNEVPFAEDCPPPNPGQRNLIFCSDARYIALLEEIGTDVVELTGDHFNDWGKEAMLFTLELYDSVGWPYYGGGANLEEGRKALLFEHNGNHIAFIGCNGKGGGYASAKTDYPGAVDCDYDWLTSEIRRLSTEGYLVIVTFQHDEVYTYKPQPGLIRDFGLVAEAGASIVSGSQAHQAHGVEFKDDDTLIMYGLGNLFFDQIVISQDTSQALIARHVFYDGRYINTELFTTVFVDYAKPRFMTTEERSAYLAQIFKASIWESATSEGSEDGS